MVLSPAKRMEFSTAPESDSFTLPEYLKEAEIIVEKLKKLNPSKISRLMGISSDLGKLNYDRFMSWNLPFTRENARRALVSFNGDVYQGLVAETLSENQLEWAQRHLRILSGLYGILKPLDLIQPYRLEMGTTIQIGRKKDLYQYWKNQITASLSFAMKDSGSEFLINLASNEYFKSIDIKKLKARIITPQFKDLKDGEYKMISFFAKKARGKMTRFIIDHKITNPEEIKAFDEDGYYYNSTLSEENQPVFTREK